MRSGSYGVSYPLYTNSRPNYKSGIKSSLSSSGLFGSAPTPQTAATANYNSGNNSDRESVASSYRSNSKRNRPRRTSNTTIKISKTMSKKKQGMDYTNYNYNTAVSRLKFLLAESYTPSSKPNFASFAKAGIEESGEETDNQSDRTGLNDISKYLQAPKYKETTNKGLLKKFKPFSSSLTKDNFQGLPSYSKPTTDYLNSSPLVPSAAISTDVQAPTEILNFIEKQEDYIEQLEKESKFCRNELSHLLGKVKDVINENEALTEHARSDLAKLNRESHIRDPRPSNSSESEDIYAKPALKKPKSPRHLSGPNIVFESKISELEAELAQSTIDLKRLKAENDELKRKQASGLSGSSVVSCELHRKQIESLQKDKVQLEDEVRRLQKTIEDLRSENQYTNSKRHITDMAIIERSQQEIEIKHLRDELDRQHERVRELQHEMARRVSEERSNAERRYNIQVDQLGGDLNNQWEQVAKLQMDLERQKRIESDMKRDISQRNAQIDELKQELKTKRSSFLSDIAQVNAEKQSLEQEITSLRLQLDRSERQAKIEAARLNAEINSLRQRLDRADADVLHAKRENLRLSDEIASLEKEVTLGEMKNELRPTRKDLDKSISEMQEKHAATVTDLEEMIQSQRQLMDKLTAECKTLTNKLEDTSLTHKMEIAALQSNVEYLTNRMINRDLLESNSSANNSVSPYVGSLPQSAAPTEYESPISTANIRATSHPSSARPEPVAEEFESSPKQFEYKQPSFSLNEPAPATTVTTPATNGYDSTTARNTVEPISAVEPSSTFTKPDSYSYQADDENTKDMYSVGEKYSRNNSSENAAAPTRSSPPRSTAAIAESTPIGKSPAYDTSQPEQLHSTDTKLYDTTTVALDESKTSGADRLQSYEQQPTAEYNQYPNQGYEQYDPQQYDTTNYEGYDQQQYEGAQQYEGQGYEEQQYQGYDQQYDQSAYQQPTDPSSQYEQSAPSLVQQQQQQIQQQRQQPQSQPLQSSSPKSSPAAATPIQPQASAKVPAGKSVEGSGRPEQRAGSGALGYSNESGGGGGGASTGGGTGAGGDKGSKNLPTKQSAQGFKGSSGGMSKN